MACRHVRRVSPISISLAYALRARSPVPPSLRGRLTALLLIVLCLAVLVGCGRVARPEGWSTGVVVRGNLFIGTMEGELVALDVRTGALTWRFQLQGEEADLAIYGTPAVADGVIYFGGYDGFLYSLFTTGGERWQEEAEVDGKAKTVSAIKVGDGSPIVSGAVYADGLILVGSSDGSLYAFDEDGNQVWDFPTGDKVWATPTVVGKVVYFGSLDRNLYGPRIEFVATTGSSAGRYLGRFT